MPQDQPNEKSRIDAVFAHRFGLTRENGSRVLADLGTKGARTFALVQGTEVSVQGERKPRRGAELAKVHVEVDGTMRKEKPADCDAWADVLAAS